jgi:hypothetical protein
MNTCFCRMDNVSTYLFSSFVGFTFTVKHMIFEASKRVVHFINTECEHEWIHGASYSSAYESVDVEGPDFRFSTTGGPLLSFLTVLLLPVVIECEAVEFSICTYNNKRYGASLNLDVNRRESDSAQYVEDVFRKLKEDTLYTPVFYIPRFLATMTERNVVEPAGVTCHFGKPLIYTSQEYHLHDLNTVMSDFKVAYLLPFFIGSGVILSGEVSECGSPALIQFDVVKFKEHTMDVWSPSIQDLFSSKVRLDEHGCESDASYESDDDAPIELKMAMGKTDEEDENRLENEEEPMILPSRKKQPEFTKYEALDRARKYCHIFHLFSGLLPPKLAMNVYQTSGADRFIEFKGTEANIVRFQHYTPLFR